MANKKRGGFGLIWATFVGCLMVSWWKWQGLLTWPWLEVWAPFIIAVLATALVVFIAAVIIAADKSASRSDEDDAL